VRSNAGFNLQIWFKTDVLLKLYNFFFYVHTFLLSRKKKARGQASDCRQMAKTERTPRKCEAWASIFVELIAVTSFFTTQNSLLLLSEFSASRSVLPRSFFFFLSPTSFFFFLERKGKKWAFTK